MGDEVKDTTVEISKEEPVKNDAVKEEPVKENLRQEESLSDHDLLVEILAQEKKQAKYAKRSSYAHIGTFLALVIALVILIPKILTTMTGLNTALSAADETLGEVNTLVAQAESSLDGLDVVIGNVDDVVVNNADYVSQAMEGLNDIDFEGLNNSIKKLETVITPFANLMSRFK